MNDTNSFYQTKHSSFSKQHRPYQANNVIDLSSTVIEPFPTDIISGRGKKSIYHPGNKYFLKKIRDNLHLYTDAAERIDKTVAIEVIVESLLYEGIQFLKYDKLTKRYSVINTAHARRKTAFALRDLLKGKNHRPSKSKQCTKRKQKFIHKNNKADDGDKKKNDYLKMTTQHHEQEERKTYLTSAKQPLHDTIQELLHRPIYDIPLPIYGDTDFNSKEDWIVCELNNLFQTGTDTDHHHHYDNFTNGPKDIPCSSRNTTIFDNEFNIEETFQEETGVFAPITVSFSNESKDFGQIDDIMDLCQSICNLEWRELLVSSPKNKIS